MNLTNRLYGLLILTIFLILGSFQNCGMINDFNPKNDGRAFEGRPDSSATDKVAHVIMCDNEAATERDRIFHAETFYNPQASAIQGIILTEESRAEYISKRLTSLGADLFQGYKMRPDSQPSFFGRKILGIELDLEQMTMILKLQQTKMQNGGTVIVPDGVAEFPMQCQ
jgi:hypothetical protein